ncbi:RTA1 like protein-domain-containing protein [Xylariales sp. PMI_506]|nr:RTA1 like protein-domain-containing protein [Xylariales sp. PMI_506]
MASQDSCTISTCPISESLYGYRPSIAANSIFLAIAACSLLWCLAVLIKTRRWIAFSISVIIGCILEIIGYLQRVKGYNDPWDLTSFINGISFLTIAPVFYTAGVYLCLGQLVLVLGPEHSFIKPKAYAYVFMTMDILCLALQAVGGGLSIAETSDTTGSTSSSTGIHIIVAGLVLQVVSLACFILLFASVVLRSHIARKASRQPSPERQPGRYNPSPGKLRIFISSLFLVAFCILGRSIYRAVELAGGLSSPVAEMEGLFIGLEGVLVAVAELSLVVFHPSIWLGPSRK